MCLSFVFVCFILIMMFLNVGGVLLFVMVLIFLRFSFMVFFSVGFKFFKFILLKVGMLLYGFLNFWSSMLLNCVCWDVVVFCIFVLVVLGVFCFEYVLSVIIIVIVVSDDLNLFMSFFVCFYLYVLW